MPHYVLEGVGSAGDVFPLLDVGQRLRSAGHSCELLANAVFEPLASEARLDFAATDRDAFPAHAGLGMLDRMMFGHLQLVASRIEAAVQSHGHDRVVVVNSDKFVSSSLVAERLGLPLVRLHLSPLKILSTESPPSPFRERAPAGFPLAFRHHQLPRFYEKLATDPRALGRVNRRRTELGLPLVESTRYHEPTLEGELAMFPPWFCPSAGDWPSSCRQLDFPLPQGRAALPERLQGFLREHRAPIAFVTCSFVREVGAFFEAALRACEALGVPGVFLSRHAPPLRPTRASVLQLPFVELEQLLPHCAAFVHTGGIGKTARGLEAGVRQIVCPAVFDQFENARLTARLGVGVVIQGRQLEGSSLTRALSKVLHEPSFSEAARRCAELVRHDGATRAAAIIEEIGSRPRNNPPVSLPTSPGIARTSSPKTVLFVVWPERGHLVAPLALARALLDRGDHVLFAGDPAFADTVRGLGFDYVGLAHAPDRSPRCTVYDKVLPGRAALSEATVELLIAFEQLLTIHHPDVVLFDTLLGAVAMLAEASSLPWIVYETDLPRERDPMVPPPWLCAHPGDADPIERSWETCVSSYHAAKERLQRFPLFVHPLSGPVIEELEQHLGQLVTYDHDVATFPVATGHRMIFCPREFDFERSRSGRGTWVGPCMEDVSEGPPWPHLPARSTDLPLIYCAFGTQSLRYRGMQERLQVVIDVVQARGDLTLVLSAPRAYWPRVEAGDRIVVVQRAPQAALLERSVLAIHHGGFNTVKECARAGVPSIVIPCAADQPRNAALVAYRDLGRVLMPEQVDPQTLDATLTEVLSSSDVQRGCEAARRLFASAGPERALALIDDVLSAANTLPHPPEGSHDLSPSRP